MKIYDAKDGVHVVASFGSGLVGASIRWALAHHGYAERRDIPVVWGMNDTGFEQAWACVRAALAQGPGKRLQVLWAAGGAGFAAGEDETQLEVKDFTRWIARLAEWGPCQAYVLSSAGGLYEGASFITGDSPVVPLRPYGRAKRDMEAALNAYVPASAVYRPSSIYGPVRMGYRLGLVATLIRNAMLGGVTKISGTASTLRDYVYAGDIGELVAKHMAAQHAMTKPRPAILASGKPSTILEVRQELERLLRRRSYVTFDASPGNARDIVFSPAAIAKGFESCDLRTGIRLAILHSQH